MLTVIIQHPGPQALRDWGPILPVVLVGPRSSLQTRALIDTGSSLSSADQALLEQLGVEPCGETSVDTLMGQVRVPLYTAEIRTPEGRPLKRGPCSVLGNRLPGHESDGVQVLIGRDVLAGLRMVYDGAGGSWALDTPEMELAPAPAAAGPSFLALAGGILAGNVAAYGATLLLQRLFRQSAM